MRALIGHTGFVGGNLRRQQSFDALFNSQNIGALRGHRFDEIWCAGVSATKWWANQHPADDWARIELLLDALRDTQAGRLVLISTVDVFPRPLEVDERTPAQTDGLHAYGLHRLRVEAFVRRQFPRHLVVRLPGLYGPGLKKNVIYDFLHANNLAAIRADSVFQFYDVQRLTDDVSKAAAAALDLVHFATEPVSVAEIAAQAFGRRFDNRPAGEPVRYDMRTIHARLWGRDGPYLEDRSGVLSGIRAFVSAEEAAAAP
jgi:nucleoside-diphosphate-sugar epimerase